VIAFVSIEIDRCMIIIHLFKGLIDD